MNLKSYTNIEQAKKLAEILPPESADMCWISIDDDESFDGSWEALPKTNSFIAKDDKQIPCWSLAALLDILPDGTNVIKDKSDTENEKYMCTVGITNDIISTFGNNPVDTCVEMIIKLKELKML